MVVLQIVHCTCRPTLQGEELQAVGEALSHGKERGAARALQASVGNDVEAVCRRDKSSKQMKVHKQRRGEVTAEASLDPASYGLERGT